MRPPRRPRSRSLGRVRRSVAAPAAVVLVLAGAGLAATHHEARPPIARATATRMVLDDARWGPAIAASGWTRSEVSGIDAGLERVSFFAGSRIVFDAALTDDGRVTHANDFRGLDVAYGAPVAHRLPFLLIAGAVFVLLTAVAPLRRMRNLDVAALASFVVPVVALDQRLVDLSVLTAYPPLLYLAVRCARRGLGSSPPAAPSTPLLTWVARGASHAQRVRALRLGVGAAALALVMTTVSASGAIDVGYAALAGASLLVRGVLPYGHMPADVVHGDTYPILTYLAYVPAAALAPVRDLWDDTTAALAMAAAGALATAFALARAVRGLAGRWPRRATGEDREEGEREAALRTALAFLAFPPVLIAASTGTTDLVLAALVAAALLTAGRPGRSTGLVAAAAWFKLVPVVLLPLWLAPLRGRALVSALAAASSVSALAVLAVLVFGGPDGLRAMVHAVAFQLQRGSLHSAWALLGLGALQPLAQAAVLALVTAAGVRLRRAPALAADQVCMAALAGAVLLGMQLAANYWSYLYLAWAYPCLAIALLAPGRDGASTSGQPPVPGAPALRTFASRTPVAVGS